MKKSLLIFCAAVALAVVGCKQNEGGTGSSSDQTTTSSGTSSSVVSTNQGSATSLGTTPSRSVDTNTPSSSTSKP